jgi:hypothetical protein
MQTNTGLSRNEFASLAHATNIISKTQLREMAPAALANHPAKTVSERYHFYPTSEVIKAMEEADWAVIEAKTAATRSQAAALYRKHAVAFADREILKNKRNYTEIPRLIFSNSHDGNAAARLSAGLWRFVCANGIQVADSLIQSVRIPHSYRTLEEVVAAAETLRANTELVGEHVETFKATTLTDAQIREFAKWAITLRQPQNSDTVIAPDDILAVKRSEDTGSSLWTVFNRVQEHLLHGGFPLYHKTDNGWTQRPARPIRGIDETAKLNTELWDLAETFTLN